MKRPNVKTMQMERDERVQVLINHPKLNSGEWFTTNEACDWAKASYGLIAPTLAHMNQIGLLDLSTEWRKGGRYNVYRRSMSEEMMKIIRGRWRNMSNEEIGVPKSTRLGAP